MATIKQVLEKSNKDFNNVDKDYKVVSCKYNDIEFSFKVKTYITLSDEMSLIDSYTTFLISNSETMGLIYHEDFAKCLAFVSVCTDIDLEDVDLMELYYLYTHSDMEDKIFGAIDNMLGIINKLNAYAKKTFKLRNSNKETRWDNIARLLEDLMLSLANKLDEASEIDTETLNGFIKKMSNISDSTIVDNILDFNNKVKGD